MNAYRKYVERYGGQRRNDEFTRHYCTSSCEFMHFKSLMICIDTAHIHICSSVRCDRSVDNYEGWVCELTGIVHTSSWTEIDIPPPPEHGCDDGGGHKGDSGGGGGGANVDHENDEDDGARFQCSSTDMSAKTDGGDNGIEDHRKKKKKCNKKLMHLLEKWKDLDVMSEVKFETPEPVKAPEQAKKEVEESKGNNIKRARIKRVLRPLTSDGQSKLFALSMRVINDAFRPNAKGLDPRQLFAERQNRPMTATASKKRKRQQLVTPNNNNPVGFNPTQPQKDEMVRVCLEKWQQITQTQLYKERWGQYQFEHHSLAVLYEMVHGFSVFRNGQMVVIVPRNEVVHTMLHQRRDMLTHNKGKWTARQITNSTKLFHMFIRELYPSVSL